LLAGVGGRVREGGGPGRRGFRDRAPPTPPPPPPPTHRHALPVLDRVGDGNDEPGERPRGVGEAGRAGVARGGCPDWCRVLSERGGGRRRRRGAGRDGEAPRPRPASRAPSLSPLSHSAQHSGRAPPTRTAAAAARPGGGTRARRQTRPRSPPRARRSRPRWSQTAVGRRARAPWLRGGVLAMQPCTARPPLPLCACPPPGPPHAACSARAAACRPAPAATRRPPTRGRRCGRPRGARPPTRATPRSWSSGWPRGCPA